jgi:hypothetical protein
MNLFFKSLVLMSLLVASTRVNAANKKGTNPDKPSSGETTETDTTVKNNIMIFKIIPTTPATQTTTTSGTLKKAGKLARTSTSPHSSIDDILYKKRGI